MALLGAFLVSPHLPGVAVRPMKKDPVKEDMKLLQGEWIIMSYVQGGKDYSASYAGTMVRTITGNRWNTTQGGAVTQYNFKIDPTKKPKTIDITMAGDGVQQSFPCIYEVDGNTLKLCQAQSGQKRPTKFTSDDGTILTIARRRTVKDKIERVTDKGFADKKQKD
jgi:uncharacterized protein (TIGR03067 family)